MRKSADVVILMQPSSNYTLLFPKQIEWEDFVLQKPDISFANNVIDFLNALSNAILKDRASRIYSDVVTFAFFCRKANLLSLKEKYIKEDKLRLGRGILFHIAPSNVPINFGYSLIAGLMSGNNNIVRVSSKQFPQVDIIINHLHKLKESGLYDDVTNRIVLVRYDRTSDASAFFSSICNVRVIWGGDTTIQTIRQNAIPARSFDVCFADRYSIAAINPEAIMLADDSEIKKIAESFYNDTYLFDQNACSAPHTIFWIKSDKLEIAKSRFWEAVHNYTAERYQLQAVMSVDKLTAFYRQAAYVDIKKESMPDNIVIRTEYSQLPKNIEDFRCACGYFSEYTVESLNELTPIINNKYQTMAYYGIDKKELQEFVISNRLKGLDRIVPLGDTTAFSFTWDGYDLIDIFSRVIDIK